MPYYSPVPDLEEKKSRPSPTRETVGPTGGAQPLTPTDTGHRLGGMDIFPTRPFGLPEGYSMPDLPIKSNPRSMIPLGYSDPGDLPLKNGRRHTSVREDSQEGVSPSPQTGLKGFAMGEHYRGEDKTLGWRADLDPVLNAQTKSEDPTVSGPALARRNANAERDDVRLTKYLTEEERFRKEVRANSKGLLYTRQGRMDTTGDGGGFGGTANSHIFALGTEGKMHASGDENEMARTQMFQNQREMGIPEEEIAQNVREEKPVDRMFHHSSFYAGGDVAGAGELRVERGRLKEITDGSGHYKPPGESTFQSVQHMARSKQDGGLGFGMRDGDNREAKVSLINKGPWDDRVSLPVSSYLQTGGNEKQIRAKRDMVGELNGLGQVTPTEAKEQAEVGRMDFDAPKMPGWMTNLQERLAKKGGSGPSGPGTGGSLFGGLESSAGGLFGGMASSMEGDKPTSELKQPSDTDPLPGFEEAPMLGRSPLQEVLPDFEEAPLLDRSREVHEQTPPSGASAGNYLSTNYGGESNYPPQNSNPVEDDDTPVPTSPIEEEKTTNYLNTNDDSPTNYAKTDYGGTTDYPDTNDGGATGSPVQDTGTPVMTPPVQKEKTTTPNNPFGFTPLSLLPQYRDEENKVGWRASFDQAGKDRLNSSDPLVREKQEKIRDSNVTVTRYLDPEQRKQFAVQSHNGLLEDSRNQTVNTSGGRGGFGGSSGTHIFALGLDGGLHMGDAIANNDMAERDHIAKGSRSGRAKREQEARERGLQNKTFHHSSFFAGGDIAGAGEIGVDEGRVRFIGDGSGHYRPGGAVMHQTVSHMGRSQEEGGLGLSLMDEDHKEARVSLMGKNDGEQAVKLPVSSFLQTGGNEKQIRSKIGLNKELMSRSNWRSQFDSGPEQGRRTDGLSPNDHVFDSDKVEDASEENHVKTESALSPSRLKAQTSSANRPDFLKALDQKFGQTHSAQVLERLTPLPEAPSLGPLLGKVLADTPKTSSSGTSGSNYLTQSDDEGKTNDAGTNYTSTNYAGETNYPGGNHDTETDDDPSPIITPTVEEETKTTNYLTETKEGGTTNYASTNYTSETNYPGTNSDTVDDDDTPITTSPVVEEEETKTNYLAETTADGKTNYASTNYSGETNYASTNYRPEDD